MEKGKLFTDFFITTTWAFTPLGLGSVPTYIPTALCSHISKIFFPKLGPMFPHFLRIRVSLTIKFEGKCRNTRLNFENVLEMWEHKTDSLGLLLYFWQRRCSRSVTTVTTGVAKSTGGELVRITSLIKRKTDARDSALVSVTVVSCFLSICLWRPPSCVLYPSVLHENLLQLSPKTSSHGKMSFNTLHWYVLSWGEFCLCL